MLKVKGILVNKDTNLGIHVSNVVQKRSQDNLFIYIYKRIKITILPTDSSTGTLCQLNSNYL